jgi:hypothetical protein
MLRERAAQVAKADLNDEGARFRIEYDKDTLRAARKANADYLRRLGTMLQQEEKSQRTPAKKAAPSAPAAPSPSRTGTSGVTGERSTAPEIENTWGGVPGEIHFHRDGVIGQELRQMGDDRLMDVNGEPLSNVVGKLATRAVMGQISQDQLVDQLRRLGARLPAGSKARRGVDEMVQSIGTPERSALDLPEGTPAPLHKLMQRLSEVPLARGTSTRRGDSRDFSEMDELVEIANDRTRPEGPRRLRHMASEIRRRLLNKRHESMEGKFDIDRAVREAMDELEEMVQRAQAGAPPPPTPTKATPRLTAIPGGRTREGRSRGRRPSLRVVRNEDGEFSLVLA